MDDTGALRLAAQWLMDSKERWVETEQPGRDRGMKVNGLVAMQQIAVQETDPCAITHRAHAYLLCVHLAVPITVLLLEDHFPALGEGF